jgi:hypothetical protein
MMLITLDNLAHRYQCLPSEALSRATTFDLYVLDVSTKWLRYQQDKADGKHPAAKQPSQQELLAMLKRARGEV